jgi:hypothetical protein
MNRSRRHRDAFETLEGFFLTFCELQGKISAAAGGWLNVMNMDMTNVAKCCVQESMLAELRSGLSLRAAVEAGPGAAGVCVCAHARALR